MFRWTLFTNDGLVVLANYDRFPYQYVLEQKYRQDGFGIALSDYADALTQLPRATIIFKEFDKKTKLCTFDIFVRDDKGTTLIERQKPSK